MDYGLKTMDYGLKTMDYGLITMDYGLITMDYGLITMDYGLFSVSCETLFRLFRCFGHAAGFFFSAFRRRSWI